jgi:PAS domain S-box-containing protein
MSKKALVVDNDFFFVEFLSELLEKRGYHVIKATDGKDGISRLKEGPIDFLFLEIITPKIDGKQLIKFIRKKLPNANFPIIAVSGYLVEQMDELNEIGADYFIAKGTMEKMGSHVDDFLDKLEETPHPDPDDKVFLEPGQVYPRQSTAVLMDLLIYQKSIIESAGVGLIVIDTDARIIHANPVSLKMLGKSLEDVFNVPITEILPEEEKEKMVQALKRTYREEKLNDVRLLFIAGEREIRTTVSAIFTHNKKTGWVLALSESEDV